MNQESRKQNIASTNALSVIKKQIFTLRGQQVMLDSDLAVLYGVEVKRLNEAVKRNIERFPEEFMFQLTKEEFENLRSQFATSKEGGRGGRRTLPYAFTEQGVVMLSAVLRSSVAVSVSIQVSNAFVQMRKFISNNAEVLTRLQTVEQKQIEGDEKFEQIFTALESKSLKPNKGIFYDGQVFDAYVFVAKLIKSAKKSIVIIDNFIDESVLQLLSKRKKGVTVVIYTKKITKVLKQDLQKHNTQYEMVEIKAFKKAHDRFFIIDEKEVYHFGASLKDLGKKWFAFSKFNKETVDILDKLSGEVV